MKASRTDGWWDKASYRDAMTHLNLANKSHMEKKARMMKKVRTLRLGKKWSSSKKKCM